MNADVLPDDGMKQISVFQRSISRDNLLPHRARSQRSRRIRTVVHVDTLLQHLAPSSVIVERQFPTGALIGEGRPRRLIAGYDRTAGNKSLDNRVAEVLAGRG